MAIFNSYVKLPEGTHPKNRMVYHKKKAKIGQVARENRAKWYLQLEFGMYKPMEKPIRNPAVTCSLVINQQTYCFFLGAPHRMFLDYI